MMLTRLPQACVPPEVQCFAVVSVPDLFRRCQSLYTSVPSSPFTPYFQLLYTLSVQCDEQNKSFQGAYHHIMSSGLTCRDVSEISCAFCCSNTQSQDSRWLAASQPARCKHRQPLKMGHVTDSHDLLLKYFKQALQ